MRVVAGSARGRRLHSPPDAAVRPTSDRVREAVGNALTSMGAIVGARVVDLFAGSGALAVEALSRGAVSAVLVEPDAPTRRLIGRNLAVLDDPVEARVVAATAQQHLAACPPAVYDLAFADPPYDFDDWDELFGLLATPLAPDGVVVAESNRAIEPPPGWDVVRSRRYGSTVVTITVRGASAPPPTGAQK